jgi:hypothetical protein
VLTLVGFLVDVAVRLWVPELSRRLLYVEVSLLPRTVSPSSFSEGWRVTNIPAGSHRYILFQSSVLLKDSSDTQPTWNQKRNIPITSSIISTSWGQQPNNMGTLIIVVTPCHTEEISTCLYVSQSEASPGLWFIYLAISQYTVTKTLKKH